MAKAKRIKEDKLDKIARLIKSESDDVRNEIKNVHNEIKSESADIRNEIKKLEQKVDLGFMGVNRRIDGTIQPQLDNHAFRIKKLETKALS
ncbi:MAG: hypothetical protein Q8Q13_01970 [bacterium]|nr:hypothetical protein [bacterium]